MYKYIKSEETTKKRKMYEFFYRVKNPAQPPEGDYSLDEDAMNVESARLWVYPNENPLMVLRNYIITDGFSARRRPSNVYDIQVYEPIPDPNNPSILRPTLVAEYDRIP